MKLLRCIAERHGRHSLDGLRIVAVQHLLDTTDALADAFIDCGALPSNLFFLGKPYSAISRVSESIRRKGCTVVVTPLTVTEVLAAALTPPPVISHGLPVLMTPR